MRLTHGRLLSWLPSVCVAVGAAVGGHVVGHNVEQLGPIGSVRASAGSVLLEAGIALSAGALALLVHRMRTSAIAAGVAGLVWVATVAGTYFAFNTIAGSHDCPGTQDCDTLIVPVLFPFVVASAVAATVGAVGALGAAAGIRRLRSS